jgi:hypothetical protein
MVIGGDSGEEKVEWEWERWWVGPMRQHIKS